MIGTAEHTGNFSTFVNAIRTAGLESALDGAGPFTLFAPTDAAFRKLPAGSVDGLLNDRGRLTSFLKSHVVPGTIMAKDSFSTKNVKTLEGGDINFETCDEFKVNGAKVVMPDIECRNGVLHGVDSVLIPVEPPARTVAAAAPAATGAKCAPAETTRAAAAPPPVREKVVEKEHVHTATCGCGQQFTAPTKAEAERKLVEHAEVRPTPKCGAANIEKPIVKEKVVEKPVAKTVAPAPAKEAVSTGAKCTPKETVVKERIVERPREKVVTKQVISDRPIAQCTTCGEQVSGTTADDAKRKLIEHERVHKEAAVQPKTRVVEKNAPTATCGCGEQFTGSTSEEAQEHLHEHERAQHGGGTIRGALREGADRVREGARDVRDTGAKGNESRSASETVRESGRDVSGRTGAAAAGAAGTIGAAAGAVAGGGRGLLERAGDAIRGRSGQYSVRCPECGEEISGSTREEAQANLTEHGKVHLR